MYRSETNEGFAKDKLLAELGIKLGNSGLRRNTPYTKPLLRLAVEPILLPR